MPARLPAARGTGWARTAQPGHPGHGPRYLWTRSAGGRTRGHQLAEGPELDKARAEVARYQEFTALTDQIAEVSEAICEARPVTPLAGDGPSEQGGERGALHPAPGGLHRRDRAPGRADRALPERRRGPGHGGAGDPRRDDPAGRIAAGGPAGPRQRPPRPPRGLRRRAPGRVRVLPGKDHRHRPGAGRRQPGLLSVRPRRDSPGRRAGRGGLLAVTGAAHDDRPGRRRRPVRPGQRPARRPRRGPGHQQASGAGRRSRREGGRRGCRGGGGRDPRRRSTSTWMAGCLA